MKGGYLATTIVYNFHGMLIGVIFIDFSLRFRYFFPQTCYPVFYFQYTISIFSSNTKSARGVIIAPISSKVFPWFLILNDVASAQSYNSEYILAPYSTELSMNYEIADFSNSDSSRFRTSNFCFSAFMRPLYRLRS